MLRVIANKKEVFKMLSYHLTNGLPFEYLDKKLENNKTFLITYMKLCDNLDKKYKRGK